MQITAHTNKSEINTQRVRTIAPERGWFQIFAVILSTLTTTRCHCVLKCGRGLLSLMFTSKFSDDSALLFFFMVFLLQIKLNLYARTQFVMSTIDLQKHEKAGKWKRIFLYNLKLLSKFRSVACLYILTVEIGQALLNIS